MGLARAAVLGLAAAWAPAVAQAHPHAWIDVTSTAIVDAHGRVEAIEQTWLFETLYTLFVTDTLKEDPRPEAEALRDMARQNLGNLAEYDYFTVPKCTGAPAAVAPVRTFETEMREGRLWLRFIVPLASPLPLAGAGFSYAIRDPTYFIDMRHEGPAAARVAGPGGDRCAARVELPDPGPEAIARAAALDRDAVVEDALGDLFAERVVLTCD